MKETAATPTPPIEVKVTVKLKRSCGRRPEKSMNAAVKRPTEQLRIRPSTATKTPNTMATKHAVYNTNTG
jgi:hypothetical protein